NANPGLTRDGIAVTCDSRRLGEVRICLGRDLRFRGCPDIDARACRREQVVMPPVRGGDAAQARWSAPGPGPQVGLTRLAALNGVDGERRAAVAAPLSVIG